MNDTMFDAWARRAVRATDRRAVFGLLFSAILATFPALTAAGGKSGYGSGGGGKKDGKGNGGKKGNKSKKKKKKKGLNREECTKNWLKCEIYWSGYCSAYPDDPPASLRSNCFLTFQRCCRDLLTCTKEANARHVECVTFFDQIW